MQVRFPPQISAYLIRAYAPPLQQQFCHNVSTNKM